MSELHGPAHRGGHCGPVQMVTEAEHRELGRLREVVAAIETLHSPSTKLGAEDTCAGCATHVSFTYLDKCLTRAALAAAAPVRELRGDPQ